MKTEISKYEQAAIDFLNKTNTIFSAEFLRNGSMNWDEDKEVRDIYRITIKRGSRNYSTEFGQSIMNSQYYQDRIPERTYTLNGSCRTGNYKITDLKKYIKDAPANDPNVRLIKGTPPTAYGFLACLTKYDPGTFEDFCREFGYDTDSRKAERTYEDVKDEYQKLCTLFTDEEMQELQEIQ